MGLASLLVVITAVDFLVVVVGVVCFVFVLAFVVNRALVVSSVAVDTVLNVLVEVGSVVLDFSVIGFR